MTEVKDVLGEYPLSRDFVDFNRLNLQHYLWKDIFGYILHPKIPRHKEGLKIADVGTGTGIWLLDLSSQLDPSAELYGFDTDITQAGPKEWLPANISLREWNAFTDVPDDLVSRFDIVNLRLFSFIIVDDPRPVLRNLIKLLKPGGYLQWSEVDVDSMRIEASAPDVPTDYLVKLWNETMPKGSRVVPTWIKSLPRMFQEEGLLGVDADWKEGKRHTSLAIHWCNLHIKAMIGARLRPTNPEKASEIDALLRGAEMQSRKGAMYVYDRVNVVGQKPGV